MTTPDYADAKQHKGNTADCIHIQPFRSGVGLAAYEGLQPFLLIESIYTNKVELYLCQNVEMN